MLKQAVSAGVPTVTDKQYGDILNFWGKSERAKPDMPQQLEFF